MNPYKQQSLLDRQPNSNFSSLQCFWIVHCYTIFADTLHFSFGCEGTQLELTDRYLHKSTTFPAYSYLIRRNIH
ncbi:unnamed protein product [Litomosoides sigmodontis]|uniref:Uncharacterized protein n=1 Tax=Litomosoides sigmodontis TaxID=42156 RepID=A0A3P6T4C9_LITSI|nr:unnamed protein product [Litomosoides sigmodontis]